MKEAAAAASGTSDAMWSEVDQTRTVAKNVSSRYVALGFSDNLITRAADVVLAVNHRPPAVDLDPLQVRRQVLEPAAGVRLLLYDVTCDTGVPTYAARIYDERTRHVGMVAGFGAHLDPGVAIVRAVTEAVQARHV